MSEAACQSGPSRLADGLRRESLVRGMESSSGTRFALVMRRLLLSLVVAATPGMTSALGLGPIEVDSKLNEALRARIELRGMDPLEVSDLRVGIGTAAEHVAAGIVPGKVQRLIRATLLPGDGVTASIELTTERVVQEPAFEFVLTVRADGLKLMRTYGVLLDPPRIVRAARAEQFVTERALSELSVSDVPASDATGSNVVPVVPVPEGDTVSVRTGDSLTRLGERLRADASVTGLQMAWALFDANPDAFIDSDPDRLIAGALLRVPSLERAGALSPSAARERLFGRPSTAPTAPPRELPVATGLPKRAASRSQDSSPMPVVAGGLVLIMDTRIDTKRVAPVRPRAEKSAQVAAPTAIPPAGDETEKHRLVILQQTAEVNPQLAALVQADEAQIERLHAAERELDKLLAQAAEQEVKLARLRELLREREAAPPVIADPAPATWGSSWRIGLEVGLAALLVLTVARMLSLRTRLQAERGAADDEFPDYPLLGAGQAPDRAHPATLELPTADAAVPSESATGKRENSEVKNWDAPGDASVSGIDKTTKMLSRVVQEVPYDIEQRVRLLRLLHDTGQRSEFFHHAMELDKQVGDRESGPWPEIETMARELFLNLAPLCGSAAVRTGDAAPAVHPLDEPGPADAGEVPTPALADPPADVVSEKPKAAKQAVASFPDFEIVKPKSVAEDADSADPGFDDALDPAQMLEEFDPLSDIGSTAEPANEISPLEEAVSSFGSADELAPLDFELEGDSEPATAAVAPPADDEPPVFDLEFDLEVDGEAEADAGLASSPATDDSVDPNAPNEKSPSDEDHNRQPLTARKK